MSTAFELYAVVTVILFLKMWALSLVQIYNRVKSDAFTKPEDAVAFGGGTPVAEDPPIVQRATMAWRNDLENIPIFLALAWVYIFLKAWPGGAAFYLLTFTAARIVHSYAFVNALQPLRFIAYAVGLLVCFAMSAHIIGAVL